MLQRGSRLGPRHRYRLAQRRLHCHGLRRQTSFHRRHDNLANSGTERHLYYTHGCWYAFYSAAELARRQTQLSTRLSYGPAAGPAQHSQRIHQQLPDGRRQRLLQRQPRNVQPYQSTAASNSLRGRMVGPSMELQRSGILCGNDSLHGRRHLSERWRD